MPLLTYQHYGLTDKGRLRQANEDNYGIFETPNGLLLLVADGMGGHAGGKIASKTAVNAIQDYFLKQEYKNIRLAITQAMQLAGQKIAEMARQDAQLYGMGSTVVLLLLSDNQIYYAHAGDSRLYHFHHGVVNLFTRDHSVIQQLLDLGIISPAEALFHPQSHKVTSALGVGELTVSVSEIPHEIVSEEIFLLCSDGLSNMVTEESMEDIFDDDTTTLSQKAHQLVRMANDAGGLDNITAVLLQIT